MFLKGLIMKDAIYDKGKVNDIVVLDNVELNLEKETSKTLIKYEQPAFFTIVKIVIKIENQIDKKFYLLRDSTGKEFDVSSSDYGGFFLEASNWARNKEQYYKEKLKDEQNKAEKLIHQQEILKEILTIQGIRIVPENQAKDIGID